MTEDEKGLLRSSLFRAIEEATNALPLVEAGDTSRLYDYLKLVHEAAIEPWCTLVDIMRAQIKPATVSVPRMTTDDFLL
jgi:hypothetical protein